eukprot:375441-Amorphochlora_amoeboformis.AAC.1
MFKLLRDAKDALDGLWQEQDFESGDRYPKQRMIHLLDLVGLAVAENVRAKVGIRVLGSRIGAVDQCVGQHVCHVSARYSRQY